MASIMGVVCAVALCRVGSRAILYLPPFEGIPELCLFLSELWSYKLPYVSLTFTSTMRLCI